MITKMKTGRARIRIVKSGASKGPSPSNKSATVHSPPDAHTFDDGADRTKGASGQLTHEAPFSYAAAPQSKVSRDLFRNGTQAAPVAETSTNAGSDQPPDEDHFLAVAPAPKPARRRRSADAPLAELATPAPTNAERIHAPCETHRRADSSALTHIRALSKQRGYLLEQRRRTTLSAKAYARSALGWKKGDKTTDSIKKSASDLVDRAMAGKAIEAPAILLSFLTVFARSIAPINDEMKRVEGILKTEVRNLPVWNWCKSERGIAELTVASLVGELGNPGNYSNPAKVWKRMGLAVTNAGEESKHSPIGSAMKNPLAGYCPRRRSVAYLIGDSFIKTKSPRREWYNERRAFTEINRPDWTKMRKHRDAHRIMVKKWLVQFWLQWNHPA